MAKIFRLQKYFLIMEKFLHDATKITFCSPERPGQGQLIMHILSHCQKLPNAPNVLKFTYVQYLLMLQGASQQKKNLGQQVYQNSFCSHKQSSSRSQQVKDVIIIIMYQLCKCVQKAKHLSLANDALLSVTAHRVLVDILTLIYVDKDFFQTNSDLFMSSTQSFMDVHLYTNFKELNEVTILLVFFPI